MPSFFPSSPLFRVGNSALRSFREKAVVQVVEPELPQLLLVIASGMAPEVQISGFVQGIFQVPLRLDSNVGKTE